MSCLLFVNSCTFCSSLIFCTDSEIPLWWCADFNNRGFSSESEGSHYKSKDIMELLRQVGSPAFTVESDVAVFPLGHLMLPCLAHPMTTYIYSPEQTNH